MSKKLPAVSTVAQALVAGLKGGYGNLGLSALHSAIWFVTHIPFWIVLFSAWNNISAGFPGNEQLEPLPWIPLVIMLILTGALLAAPANAAMLHVVKTAREDEARVRDFFIGLKRYFLRAASVYTVFLFVLALLIANMAAAVRLKSWFSLLSLVFTLYAGLFVLTLSNYLFPLMVFQPNTVRKIWKKAALLTLDNGFLTVFFSLVTLVLYVLSGVFPILLVLFYPAALGYMHHHLFSSLLDKYEENGVDQEAVEVE